jgi:predicted neuraminidase
LNLGKATSRHRRAATRRAVILGAAVAGATVIGWKIRTSRKFRCFLFPGAHQSNGTSLGVIGRENIFANAPFAECHASTLADTGPALVCSWHGGSDEGQPDVAIWMSTSSPTGWSSPRLVTEGMSATGEKLACWNPVLWQQPEGPLYLFYKIGNTPRSWWGMVVQSQDGGRSWSAPIRLPEGIFGPIKNKPVMLEDGRLLCPSSTEHDGWRVHFEWTSDHGRTWQRTEPIGDGETIGIIQPTLFVHMDQRLQALCRSQQGRIAEIWSEDGGRTWSEPKLTDLPNPNSGIDGLTLSDGRHLLVHNPISWCRTHLVVSLSEDGEAWREIATLESGRGEYSYPAIIQQDDGLVHISYTNRRKTITHVTMDPGEF